MPYAFKKYFMRTPGLILLSLVSLITTGVFTQTNNFVYQISIKRQSGKDHLQSGFRLKGTPGIITCLHGVAGAVSITASNSDPNLLKGLKVAKVDIENDLALLLSP